MTDWNALVNEVSRLRLAAKPKEQFTLGMLIAALERVPDDQIDVRFDFGGLYPTTFDSYRGYYEDLALGYEDVGRHGNCPTVATILAAAKAAEGTIFTGWKGGDYRMDGSTILWVANPGCTGGTAIVGVDADDYDVILRTEKVE